MHVCHWEWQDNRQPVWCPAVITQVEGEDFYSVKYQHPLAFKTEEKIEGGWRYGKTKKFTEENHVFFARIRSAKE